MGAPRLLYDYRPGSGKQHSRITPEKRRQYTKRWQAKEKETVLELQRFNKLMFSWKPPHASSKQD